MFRSSAPTDTPLFPQHPRALLTLLEGLAPWAGRPLTVVISALPRHVTEALFGAGPLPCDSALVSFEVIDRLSRRRTLRGVGDFRLLQRLQRRWA